MEFGRFLRDSVTFHLKAEDGRRESRIEGDVRPADDPAAVGPEHEVVLEHHEGEAGTASPSAMLAAAELIVY
uniref:Archease domain-containing protein n=1 Tax=Ascaris lumbricoides TaxID=6252 RepID=A0A0M3IJ21_ASCLU